MTVKSRCREDLQRFSFSMTMTMTLVISSVILLCARIAVTDGSVINDVNNMLRDVATEAAVPLSPTQNQILKDSASNDIDNNNDNENDNDNDDDGYDDDVITATAVGSDSHDETSVELLRFVNDNDVVSTSAKQPPVASQGQKADDATLSLHDQVRLLAKQLNVLMTRRREDYELLERNLRKSLRIKNIPKTEATDLRNELEQLRMEVETLRAGHLNGNKERLTIEWLQQSVGELRKQLVELQQIASNAMRDVSSHTQRYEDLATIRSDFHELKLELASLKERQQQTEVYVQELREETVQQEENYRRSVQSNQLPSIDAAGAQKPSTEESDELLADHKRRHCRFQRQQIHDLQLAQRQLKRQFNELKYHRIGERVRSIEIEQHRIANANFNLSRQIASLDKLHSSMLELLEDVEGLQTKIDKNVPELRHEISKLEFSNAQLLSEQSLVREEGKNVARSVQAMAVSVSTLQEERDGVRHMQATVGELRTQMDRLQSTVADIQRALVHRHHGGDNKTKKTNQSSQRGHQADVAPETSASTATLTEHAEQLVAKLENVEAQYESIVDKLPHDCGDVSNEDNADREKGEGLYLIAPAGQHRPIMAHCSADGWTTVQRRYDGSADFNRSWEDYAAGFGTPAGEYWIGNEQLHHLTLNNCTGLRVLMQDIYDNVWLAEYKEFYISSRADGYRLHIGGYSGNASDALDYQQGMQFSAIDVDRDISQTHCAANYEGGWWFSHCQHANLNGRYNLGLTWFDAARNEWIAVKSSQMLIKRQSAATCAYVAQQSNDSPVLSTASPTATTTEPTTTTTTTTSMTIVSNELLHAAGNEAASAALL